MKSRILGVLLVLSLGFNVGLLLPRFRTGEGATGGSEAAQTGCGWHISPLRTKLGLTTAQAEQMEADRGRMLERLAPLQTQLRGKRQALFELFRKTGPDSGALERLLQEIATLQAQIEKAVVEHALQVKGMLDAPQLERYEALLESELCPMGNSHATCLPGCADAARHQDT